MPVVAFMRKRSLQTKSFLSLTAIGAFGVLGMLLGFFCTRLVAREYEAMLKSNARFELLLTRVMGRMTQVSRDEYAFVATRNEEILGRREQTVKQVKDALDELIQLPQELITQTELQAFEDRVNNHQKYFEVIARVLKDEGSAQSGYLGALRKAAHSVEGVLKANTSFDQPRIMVSYLTIRRHEKDYLARRDASYIDKLDDEIANLHKILGQSQGFSAKDKAVVLEAADSYREILRAMHKGYVELKASTAQQEAGLQFIDEFLTRSSAKVSESNEQRQAALHRIVSIMNWIFLLAAIASLGVIVFSLKEFAALARSLSELSHTLRRSGEKNLETSQSLYQASSKTSQASSAQASAIQETVASVNQISAIIDKSVGSVRISAEKAELSFQITSEGKRAVNAMRETMTSIRETMNEMMNQTQQGNQRMQHILTIIEKIVERTQVINDIVFQTRLLAFNASVEAARAGEQGKGFAVVAEEVGNLARMSGDASKVISSLLQDSRKEVLEIIDESHQQVERMNLKGSQKVEAGVEIAYRCDEILSEVVDHVGFVKALMNEMESAAQEEASGIHNITSAMNELDSSTAMNSDMAHHTLSVSKILREEAAALSASVTVLSQIVLGSSALQRQQAAQAEEDEHQDDASMSQAA